MKRKLGATLKLIAALVMAACTPFEPDAYTLYRNSVLDASMRIHMATFDAKDSDNSYNQQNCMLAAKLFQSQPGVATTFWCEKGGYKK